MLNGTISEVHLGERHTQSSDYPAFLLLPRMKLGEGHEFVYLDAN
jgi:hypothetical protein